MRRETGYRRAHASSLCTRVVLAFVLLACSYERAFADTSPPPPSAPTSQRRAAKIWSLTGLSLAYAGLGAWAYWAFYRDRSPAPFAFRSDGWFGRDTYSGGADKVGHLWDANAISRVSTQVLRAGGWEPMPASLLGSGLGLGVLTAMELKDGYYFGFSGSDTVFNVLGAALSLTLENLPAVDELIDLRLEYWPSQDFLHERRATGTINIFEDYSGQTYYLAVHLGPLIPSTSPRYVRWLGYLDVVGAYQARGFRPIPDDPARAPQRHVFVGVALNVQALADLALGGRKATGFRVAQHVSHTFTELVSVPYTTWRVAGYYDR